MKKALCILAAVLLLLYFGVAQMSPSGNAINSLDKLGPHQNGGRGCSGCHAPHRGASGAGGSVAWGQDLGPLYGLVIRQGEAANARSHRSFETALPTSSQLASMPAEVAGIMKCLSCHDGNIARGAMMTNQSYEQAAGLLPAGLYGSNQIPTLLGNDGTASGNYFNDHPVGPQATLGAVGVADRFVYTPAGCNFGDCLKVAGSASDYQVFVSHYGAPSITSNGRRSPLALPDTNPSHAYVVCTTCHDPHSMNRASVNTDAPIAGHTTGTHVTYFFVSAPYNPGSKPGPRESSSTTQFCRQCHFAGSTGANEASGIMNVTTAF